LPVPMRRHHVRVWLGILIVIVGAVLAAGAYEYVRSRRGASAPDGAVTQSPQRELPAPAGSSPASGQPSQGEAVPLGPERGMDAPAASNHPAEGGDRDATPPAAVADLSTSPPSASATRIDQITVEFVRESWLEVRDGAGKVLYSGTGAANTTRSLEAEGPLTVVIGNAPGVRITYNGKPIDVSAHAERNIARFTLE